MTPAERRSRIRHYEERRAALAAGEPVSRKERPTRQKRCTPKTIPIPELTPWDAIRLWALINQRGPDECWPRLGALGDNGYGRFKIEGRLFLPHRLVYALDKGRFADAPEYHGSVVMHSCDNPSCCNPAHLSVARQVHNVADMIAKGRAHQFGRAVPPR